jgi:hypothetical protein
VQEREIMPDVGRESRAHQVLGRFRDAVAGEDRAAAGGQSPPAAAGAGAVAREGIRL